MSRLLLLLFTLRLFCFARALVLATKRLYEVCVLFVEIECLNKQTICLVGCHTTVCKRSRASIRRQSGFRFQVRQVAFVLLFVLVDSPAISQKPRHSSANAMKSSSSTSSGGLVFSNTPMSPPKQFVCRCYQTVGAKSFVSLCIPTPKTNQGEAAVVSLAAYARRTALTRSAQQVLN